MNLLTEENKIIFKKYYLKRLFAIFGILIFSIIAAGSVVLIPMHSLILSYKNDLSAELGVSSKKDAELGDIFATLEIKKLNNRLSFVEKMSQTKKLNLIFKNIIDIKNSGVKITYFFYEKGKVSKIKDKVSAEKDKISLNGKAKKREDLILFENRLKEDMGDSNVVSPVSNLINEKDFDFSLTLYIQNEK